MVRPKTETRWTSQDGTELVCGVLPNDPAIVGLQLRRGEESLTVALDADTFARWLKDVARPAGARALEEVRRTDL